MDPNEQRRIFLRQMARDLSIEEADLVTSANLFVKKRFLPGRRIYDADSGALLLMSVCGKLVFSCQSDALRGECEAAFRDAPPEWMAAPARLRRLDSLLAAHHAQIGDFHHFYLPDGTESTTDSPSDCMLRVLEPCEIASFRGDPRFDEAFAFNDNYPDVLGVSATRAGEIVAMAGASMDSADMWQIGINTLPAARGQKIASATVARLKHEVLLRGKLPFYSTAESHIASQRVAIHSGFLPAWWELYSQAQKDET